MPVILSQTREQLRASIGYNLGAVYVSSASAAGNSAGTTLIDNTLEDADAIYGGRWVILTSGGNDGNIRTISRYVGPTKTATFRSACTGQITNGMTYEMWSQDMNPVMIHDCINRAIRAVPRKASPFVTSYAFHTARGVRSFDIPTAITGIQKVSYRSQAVRTSLLPCDTVFDESVTANVTVTADAEDYRFGGASVRFNIAGSVGTGLLASDSITSRDLSKYDYIEFWAKSTTAAAAGNMVLRLSATANAASSTDDLALPALSANVWTFCRVALNNPHLDTAIISIGLRQDTDIGAAYIWLDDVAAVVDKSAVWTPINRLHWSINEDARRLVLSSEAVGAADYSLLEVVGVQKPTQLTADSTTCDVEPEYIIAKATALAMRQHGNREQTAREAAFIEADRWETLAQQAMARIQTPQGVRWIQD